MRVSTKIVLSIESGSIIKRECYEYSGPIAEAFSAGASGSASKSKSKNQSQQTSESGTKYNQAFMDKATAFAKDPSNPTYNPQYVPGQYTSVAPGGFDKLENSLYGGQQSKLAQAYQQSVGQQREELAQSGALNSPSQYLEGSARSSLDRSYIQNLQQAARDAYQSRLGLETSEAARKTGFDTSEATRQTGFNEQTQSALLDAWMKKIGLAIEAGRYSQGQGTSYGTSSSSSGSGGANASFMSFGGGSS
ncbi:MAG: hypothetical protein V4563_13050 [Pseudomonadota bacterium]